MPHNLTRLAAASAGGLPVDGAAPDRDLVACAIEHQLGPLLYWRFRQEATLDRLAAPIRSSLTRAAREAVLIESIRVDDTAATIDALIEAGLVPVVFKGAAVSVYYPERWTRPRSDTDILVPASHAAAAASVLERLGFERFARPAGRYVTQQARFTALRHGVPVAIDLHWRLTDPHVFAGVLAYDELRREGGPHPDNRALMPCGVHTLVIACLHRIAHHGDELSPLPLFDIDLVARTMNAAQWQAFVNVAERGRIRAVCHRSLSLATALFNTPVPAFVTVQLAAAAAEPSRAFVGGLRRIDALWSDLMALPQWRARLELLQQHVFPPPAYMRAAYGPLPAAVLPVIYMKRLLRGVRDWCA